MAGAAVDELEELSDETGGLELVELLDPGTEAIEGELFDGVSSPHVSKGSSTSTRALTYLRATDTETPSFLKRLEGLELIEADLRKTGISIGVEDMLVPEEKSDLVNAAKNEVARIDEMYQNGLITEGERYNKVIDQWTTTTEAVQSAMMQAMTSSTASG